MFSYIRYFSIISLVLVLVAAYLVGVYFREQVTKDVVNLAHQNNQAYALGYANSVWKARFSHINWLQYKFKEVEKWREDKKVYPQFRDSSLDYFDGTSLALVAFHARNGRIFLSTRPAAGEISGSDQEGRALLQRSLAGQENQRLLENTVIYSAHGQAKRGSVVQSFIPLHYLDGGKKGPAIALLQFQTDVTGKLERLSALQYGITGSIILVFLIFVLVLLFAVARAEAIIAKQHELNVELSAAVAAAEAENRDKSQFLANISHELRTPLNAVIGFSEILKNDLSVQLSNQHREYLDDIHASGKHLLSLINDILDYSKAEAGKLEVDISEIDALKMVKNSLRLVIPRAEQAQVTLMEDLPSKPFILQTDAKKIKQVLLNLLSNAVKFTPAGGEVRVSCWHNPETDKVTFEIKDTGVGIAQKDIARVMTPFGQADSTLARRFEGTGLGLPLSKKFVEVMGGTFTLTSEVNKGTTVTLVFPRLFDKDAAAKVIATSVAPTSV